jgi:hypothetical protein
MVRVGILLQQQWRLEEAEGLYQRAMKGYEKALGYSHPDMLSTVNNLAI